MVDSVELDGPARPPGGVDQDRPPLPVRWGRRPRSPGTWVVFPDLNAGTPGLSLIYEEFCLNEEYGRARRRRVVLRPLSAIGRNRWSRSSSIITSVSQAAAASAPSPALSGAR